MLMHNRAVGGDAFIFPENVGLPVGVDGTARFALMQTHYNNQERVSVGGRRMPIDVDYVHVMACHGM